MSYIIKFFSGGNTTVASVIWPILCGAFLAVIIAHINKKTVGILVKRLIESGALSKEKAKSLKDLDLQKKSYLKYALRPSSPLSSLIKTEKTESSIGYYIPEDKAYRAEAQYKPDGSTIVTVIVCAVIFIAAGLCLVGLVPNLISLASSVFIER